MSRLPMWRGFEDSSRPCRLDSQEGTPAGAGCEKIIEDTASGGEQHRSSPEKAREW